MSGCTKKEAPALIVEHRVEGRLGIQSPVTGFNGFECAEGTVMADGLNLDVSASHQPNEYTFGRTCP
jgi:hypothetical protein